MPKEFGTRSMSLTSQESYSAVIIADLVAEVQQEPELDRRNIAPVGEESCEKVAPISVNIDGVDNKDKKDPKTNGTNISKGVILNALQFGQNDTKLRVDNGKQVISNVSQITSKDAAKKEKTSNFKEEFKQMSALRKVAFGFSFLPSIMFVLCFAVIFPCEKILPCLQEQWSISLNGTEITSDLMVPHNVILAFADKFGSGYRSLSESSGEKEWENTLNSSSKFSACGKLAHKDRQSCLIMDNDGVMHLFDPTNGKNISELTLTETSSLPVILPDCDDDGLDEIAVASTGFKRILFPPNISSVQVIATSNNCDSMPSLLLPWKRQNETDLLFICQKGKNETLQRISQKDWCSSNTNSQREILTLKSTPKGVLSQSKILRTNDSLILWSQDEITMYKPDGSILWSVMDNNHTSKNRFLLNGKSRKGNSEVLLYSSDILNHLLITRLNSENGSLIQTKTVRNMELTEAVLMKGDTRDFLVGIKKKIAKSLKSEAVAQINEVSATVISILTKENTSVVASNSSSSLVEEVTLMELDGTDVHTLQSRTISYTEGDFYSSKLTVLSEEGKENEKHLKVYILRKPLLNPLKKSSTLTSISLANWDISSTKASQCVWK